MPYLYWFSLWNWNLLIQSYKASFSWIYYYWIYVDMKQTVKFKRVNYYYIVEKVIWQNVKII